MKNSIKTLVVFGVLATAGLANAQNSASATATANATIACPLSIVDNSTNGNLEFGKLTNSSTGGTAVVSPTGTETFTGGVAATTGTNAGNTPHAANFTVTGQSGFTYTITPTITTNFNGTGATLSALTSSLSSPATLPAGGGCVSQPLAIGGTLTITPAASGTYVATINVAVAYN